MRNAAPSSRWVAADGIRLHVVDWGGDGPPAILHHATGFLSRVYDPFARHLARHFHVYGFDARGHGASDKPSGGYRWEAFIGDLVTVVEALGIIGAIGVGHSLGGTTVAGAAASRPGLFRRAVLLDPILLPREFRNVFKDRNPMAEAALRRRDLWPSREAVLASYAPRPPFESWRHDALDAYVEHGFEPAAEGGVRLRCPPSVEAQVFAMALDFDGWGQLDSIAEPTLVVRGEKSDTFSVRDMAQAMSRLRHGVDATIADAGHLFPMEKPERLAEVVTEFAAPDRTG